MHGETFYSGDRGAQHKLSVREYQGYYLAPSVAPRVAK